MARQCTFCPNPANTKEHLWAEWILQRLPKTSRPIRAVFGSDKPIDFGGEVTVKCVCKNCNHGWMSDLEGANKPFVQAMMTDLTVPLSREQQRQIAVWATKTAMVLEATHRKRAYPPVYKRDDCEQLRLHSTIPERTLIWLGRMADPGVFASGTHIWLEDNLAEPCDGQVSTFIVGYLAVQVLTIVVRPQGDLRPLRTRCRVGPWDDSLLGIWPTNQAVTWPPSISFTARSGPLLFTALRDRFKFGRRRPD